MSAGARREAVTAAVRGWQRQLAVTGGPNTLLWFPEAGSEHAATSLDLTTAHPSGLSMLMAGRQTRLSDLVRERSALADALRRARQIRAHAGDLQTRRGLTTCFLAAGLATWDHPKGLHPQAPVLLRRVELRPTDAAASDFELDLGAEIEVNPVLEEYLRTSAGLDLDTRGLAGLASATTGFDPYPVYAALARLCASVPGFTVSPRLIVGTFPHAKLAMVADLGLLGERLQEHDVVAALAGVGESHTTDELAPPADVDPDPDPGRETLVLDADDTQSVVVDAVRRGRSMVVSAPPATGTSHTIANIVATLAAAGRSVLLVSQQTRGIDDVRSALADVGLGDLVLDATGAAADPGSVVSELAQRAAPAPAGADRPAEPVNLDRLREHREALRAHVHALHLVRQPWGVSAFDAQNAILELGSRVPAPASRVRLPAAALGTLTRPRLEETEARLVEAVAAGAWVPAGAHDPWFGARIASPEDAERAEATVTRLLSGDLDRATAILDGILGESSLPPAARVRDWQSAMATMTGVSETLEVFRPEIFDMPLDEHVAATGSRAERKGGDAGLGWLGSSRVRRQARALLRPGRPPADLHAEIVRARAQREAWHALVGAGGRPEISPRLDEGQTVYAALEADLTWLEQRLATTSDGGDLRGIPVTELRSRLAALAGSMDRLHVLPQVSPTLDALRAAGLGEVVDDFAARSVTAEQVRPELEHIWWVSVERHVADSDAAYGRHDGARLRAEVEAFAAADHEHLEANADRLRREVAARREAAAKQHRSLLAGLTSRRSTGGSVRELWDTAPDLLHALAPCWAMSPLTVAETLPPQVGFDVVVVDGATQLPTASAISALARARQAVVFGDELQGGPTAFEIGDGFDLRAGGDSVFEALGRVLPSVRLRWVHGVADGRLVALADRLAYAGALRALPGPLRASPVSLVEVDGREQVPPGHEESIETTAAEVDAVVELVSALAVAADDAPPPSVLVVALSPTHADAVRAGLAAQSGHDLPADLRVVDLREVAGLVADVVVLTVGLGKTLHGRVLHRFPSLGVADATEAGQETSALAVRGLASALTAGRQRLVVVSALQAADLEVERLTPAGALLREVLAQAEGDRTHTDEVGVAEIAEAVGGPSMAAQAAAIAAPDGPPDPGPTLMSDLAERLRREGFTVVEDVGEGWAAVDVAVVDPRDPARFLLAVESDGPRYASVRGSRSRDRLRAEELRRLGWEQLRVWSTDLYRDPAREVSRVVRTVRGLVQEEPDAGADERLEGDAGEGLGSDGGGALGSDAGERLKGAATPDAELHPDGTASAPEGTGSRRRRRAVRRGSADLGARDDAGAEVSQTRDDTDAGWGERPDERGHEQWLQEQRPPHWG